MAKQTKRVALVTGGSRGIGLGIAECLAESSFDLAINGVRDAAQVADTLAALEKRGASAIYCQGNVAEAADRAAIVDAVRQCFGRLDVLVNNAGVAPNVRADVLDATEESFDRVIGINLRGPYFLTQLAARWMIDNTPGSVGTVGSPPGVVGRSPPASRPARFSLPLVKNHPMPKL